LSSCQKFLKNYQKVVKFVKNNQKVVKKLSKVVKKMSKNCQKSGKSSVSKNATFYSPQKNVTFCHSFYYIKSAEEFSAFLDHMRQSRIW
jgi:hypothetical protein